MIWAILGNSNVGKTVMESRFEGGLHFPVHFLRIAASRLDKTAFWEFPSYAEHFKPDKFRVVQGRKHPGEHDAVKALCDGKTKYEQDCDMDLVRYMMSQILGIWKEDGADIVAEGEIMEKRNWIDALSPDRVVVIFADPRQGIPRGERKGKPWPAKVWTEEAYWANQQRLLDAAKWWITR